MRRKSRQSSMHAERRILTLRCMTTPSQTSRSRREWVSGRVRNPKKEDRTDTLPGRDSSLIKLVTRLFQADCHNRPRWCQLKGLAGGRVWTLHLTADSDRRSGLLWPTLTIRARAVFGRNSKHLEPVGTKSPGRSRGSHQNRPTPTKAGSVTAP